MLFLFHKTFNEGASKTWKKNGCHQQGEILRAGCYLDAVMQQSAIGGLTTQHCFEISHHRETRFYHLLHLSKIVLTHLFLLPSQFMNSPRYRSARPSSCIRRRHDPGSQLLLKFSTIVLPLSWMVELVIS